MKEYDCSCQGSNENCMRCYGTGLTEKPPRPPLEFVEKHGMLLKRVDDFRSTDGTPNANTLGAPINSNRLQSLGVRSCSLCGLSFRRDEFVSHCLTVHLREFEQRLYHDCPTCGVRTYSKEQLDRHIRRKHAANVPQAPASTQRKGFSPCPTCNAFVLTPNLARHIKRKHGPEAQKLRDERARRRSALEARRTDKIRDQSREETSPAGRGQLVTPTNSRELGTGRRPSSRTFRIGRAAGSRELVPLPHRVVSGTSDRNPEQPRMDATYGLGGTARDNGRFGSPVSYDAMDDESSP